MFVHDGGSTTMAHRHDTFAVISWYLHPQLRSTRTARIGLVQHTIRKGSLTFRSTMDLWLSPTKSGRRHRKDVSDLVVFCGWSHFLPSTGVTCCTSEGNRIIHWSKEIGQHLKIFEGFVVAGHSMRFFWWSHVVSKRCFFVSTGRSCTRSSY